MKLSASLCAAVFIASTGFVQAQAVGEKAKLSQVELFGTPLPVLSRGMLRATLADGFAAILVVLAIEPKRLFSFRFNSSLLRHLAHQRRLPCICFDLQRSLWAIAIRNNQRYLLLLAERSLDL